MKGTMLKTKDGKEVSLDFLNRSKTFRLGLTAGKQGWGQEGGAWQKNGPAFRIGWWAEQALRPKAAGMDLPYNEEDIVIAIDKDTKEKGNAYLDGEPTGIYLTFLIGSKNADHGYNDIYSPTFCLHFTLESVEYERTLFKGSSCRLVLISFETLSRNPLLNGTHYMLYEPDWWALEDMIRSAKKNDQLHNLNKICRCFFSIMFAERTLRKWLADGCPKDEHVKVLET